MVGELLRACAIGGKQSRTKHKDLNMTGRLAGKVALITGGTSGIGEAIVELFVAEGARFVIVGRNEKRGAEMVAALGGATRFVRADVTKEDDTRTPSTSRATVLGGLTYCSTTPAAVRGAASTRSPPKTSTMC